MLLRGGRREALVEGAVVPLEAEGEGVEAGGDDDSVVGAPADGSVVSLNDIFAMRSTEIDAQKASVKWFVYSERFVNTCCVYISFLSARKDSMRDDPADRWRGVGVEKGLIVFPNHCFIFLSKQLQAREKEFNKETNECALAKG